jgi:hypothetical protein
MMGKSTFSIFSLVLFVSLVGSPISSSAGGSDYHVLINDEQRGPMTTDQLEELKQDGTLTSDTMVWKGGMAAWGKAGEQEDLEKLFAAVVTPPAPPPTPSVPPPTPGGESEKASSTPEAIAEASDIAGASMPDTEADPGMMMEDAIEKWKRSSYGKKVMRRARQGHIYVGQGMSEVDVGPESKDWAKWRNLAFEKAVVDAENQYLAAKGVEIKADKVRSFFADANQKVPDFSDEELKDKGKMGRILDKLLSVGEGHIDGELEKLGIDPEEFKTVPKPQRHKMLDDSISKSTIKTAIGSLAGVLPLKTFEAKTEKGEHMIGVIIVASDRLRQFAHDILTKRGEFEQKKDPFDLYNDVTADKVALLNEFGVRKVIDEQGYEVLISYGQWANSSQSTDKRVLRKFREAAKIQARNNADNSLAFYLAGSAQYTDEGSVGGSVEQAFDVHADNYQEEIVTKEITDVIRQNTKGKANVKNIVGLEDLYTWAVKHPEYGHEMVGVVRIWSPTSEKKMRAQRDWKPEDEKKTDVDEPELKTKAEVTGSKEQMKADDF